MKISFLVTSCLLSGYLIQGLADKPIGQETITVYIDPQNCKEGKLYTMQDGQEIAAVDPINQGISSGTYDCKYSDGMPIPYVYVIKVTGDVSDTYDTGTYGISSHSYDFIGLLNADETFPPAHVYEILDGNHHQSDLITWQSRDNTGHKEKPDDSEQGTIDAIAFQTKTIFQRQGGEPITDNPAMDTVIIKFIKE